MHTDRPCFRTALCAREWTIDLFVDLTLNLFTEPGDHRTRILFWAAE
jgi:hypothetical protein